MNPEHLELYRKLSATKIYKERFGEWAVGDRYWFAYHKKIYFYDERHFMVRKPPESPFMKDVIWFPPVFDIEQPQRSLWGMVDWKSSHSVCPEADVGIVSLYSGDRQGIYGPLDIALVKTILAQEASHDTR